MAYEVSTAGVTLKYAVESTAGTKPSSFATAIPNVKGIPAMDAAPNSIDATDLSDLVYKKYIPGLVDVGGDIAIDCNLTSELQTAWTTMCTAWSGLTGGKEMWFEIAVPGISAKKFYFTGKPIELGIGAISVDSILEIQGHIAPHIIKGWQ